MLRTNMKLDYPNTFIFVDTETSTIADEESKHVAKLKLGVACYIKLDGSLNIDKEIWETFYHITDFWNFFDHMTRWNHELQLYAHNWSFDFPVLNGFHELERRGWQLKSIVDQSPPIILRYTKEGRKLTVIDSMNFYQQSLDAIGKSIGVSKYTIDFETATANELELYCKRDVTVLREAMLTLIRFLSANDLCRLTHTISSLAFSAYIRNFKPVDIYIDGNEDRVAISRLSYFGGRTECFRVGEYSNKFYLIDINSQYPFVMRNNYYPFRTFTVRTRVDQEMLGFLIQKYCVTAVVDLNTSIPAFPYKIGGRTCFPVGTFTTTLSTPEIEYALNYGFITRVRKVVLHYRAKLFQSYVDYFYGKRIEAREEGNKAWAELYKKLLNTLYGKFGQQGYEWEEIEFPPRGYPGRWSIFDAKTRKRVYMMEVGGKVWYSKKENESRDSYPAIAAHVTAHGRIYLQLMIDYLGREHVYYCDTDSLLIDRHAYDRIKHKLSKSVLGCWSLDGEYDKVNLRGPKDYVFGSKEKIKGVKKKHVVVKEGLYRVIQFSNLKGLIRANHTHAPIIKHVEKHLERVYRKGLVRDDGVVEPFVLVDGVVVS